MIASRKRAIGLVAVSVVLLFASCRSQNESVTSQTPSPETIVSSTPPFQTKEPARYSAIRTITTVNNAGETRVTKTSVARDGESRRQEFTLASNKIVYLDVPEGKFVLLPDENGYAELTDKSSISADKDDEIVGVSPESLLHEDAAITSYQRLGAESTGGRKTNKYRISVNRSAAANVSQSETLMWIDEALQMPVRSETRSSDGTIVTMELSEIKLEVDKRSFRIPEGYQKLTFAELRKRLSGE